MDLKSFMGVAGLCLSLCVVVKGSRIGVKTRVVGIGEEEGGPIGTGDVIMKEDAQEIFYNVDFDNYEGR